MTDHKSALERNRVSESLLRAVRRAVVIGLVAGMAMHTIALFGAAASAAEKKDAPMLLPLDEQVTTFLKALAYDRNLHEKARGDILIGLLYVPTDVESEAAARNVAKLIAACPMKAIGDLPVFYRLIPYKDKSDLAAVIADEWIEVLYLAPGVSSLLDSVLAVTSASKVLSVTGVTEDVARGVTLGLGARDGHAEMFVNLPSAQNEGSRFESHFLNLCTVIRAEAEPRGSIAPKN
ncbi:MAG: YfiR/HmsC family protein [bacterium]